VGIWLRRDGPHRAAVAAATTHCEGVAAMAVRTNQLLVSSKTTERTTAGNPRWVNARLLDRLPIVVIPRRLGEQEQVFMTLRRPVGDRFRHRIGFGPDDIGSAPPPVGLEREGDAPGNADEILDF